MRKYIVGSNEHHLTFQNFFARRLAATTPGTCATAVAAGRFTLNGVLLSRPATILKTGDEIGDLLALAAQPAMPAELAIVYEDDDLLVVDKPFGMLSHPEKGMREKDVLTALKALRDAAGYAPANRLDYNTCGLMIVAKNHAAAGALTAASRANRIVKTYLCVVSGYLPQPEATLRAYLLKDAESALVRIADVPIPGAQPIATKYRVLLEKGDLSLLEVELVTGKTHQIRAHMAFVGHPVVGDPLYGNAALNRRYGLKHQALASSSLAFVFPEPDHPFHRLDGRQFHKKDVDFLDVLQMRRLP